MRLSSQEKKGSNRLIEVELTAPAGTESLALFVKPDANIVACSLHGQRVTVPPSAPLLLRYTNPPPGPIIVTIEAAIDAPSSSLVSEATGLPGTSLLARRPLSRPCYGDPTGRSFFAVLHCQAATLRH